MMIKQWLAAFAVAGSTALATCAVSAQTIELRYGHMNPPNSASGMQAQMLADTIAKNTGGGAIGRTT